MAEMPEWVATLFSNFGFSAILIFDLLESNELREESYEMSSFKWDQNCTAVRKSFSDTLVQYWDLTWGTPCI